jgi:hypothetical protein
VRPVLITAVVLGACAFGSSFYPAASQPPQRLPAGAKLARPGDGPAHPYGIGTVPFEYREATSCAAASCHGGGQVGKVGSEHSTWAPEAFPKGASDPHNKAYRVLFRPLSTEMGRKLGLKEAPHKEKACLICHAVDSGGDPETRDQILAEGVGCGGCHGPSNKWVSEHYSNEWKALSNQEKWENYGFVPTKNLVARTLNCASCHVGDAAHDMNHDFIAAGHPRLAFEPARFHAQADYRKHWKESGTTRDFEVRVWVVGQIATLRAAVNLLAERAGRAAAGDGGTPWPEFSGYSCYACHEKLPEATVRRTVSASTRKPGVPGWELWSNAAAGIAVDSCGLAFPGLSSSGLSDVKLPAVDALRELMGQKVSLPAGDVRDRSVAARDELDRLLVALQRAEDAAPQGVAPDAPRLIANRLAANALRDTEGGTKLADHDWDALAANYLGAAAMSYAAGKGAAAGWEPPLLTLRRDLRFPEIKDGGGAVFNSPADRDRAKLATILDDFKALRTKTSTQEGK